MRAPTPPPQPKKIQPTTKNRRGSPCGGSEIQKTDSGQKLCAPAAPAYEQQPAQAKCKHRVETRLGRGLDIARHSLRFSVNNVRIVSRTEYRTTWAIVA